MAIVYDGAYTLLLPLIKRDQLCLNARRMGILNKEGERRQIELLEKAGLPTRIKDIDTSKIIKALARDKKVKEGKIRFILATEIGKVETRDDVPPEIIKEVLQEITI